ncbi:jg16080 [Pararge aegeria aegeria]|uniref:Jg16080 protein n=1 Tax=Pararge aegeria aegeria TaxID=348720 RepID=A0A8S4QWK6_9NEOP|nr:jg16080 [Pararge aegeria aegeria]
MQWRSRTTRSSPWLLSNTPSSTRRPGRPANFLERARLAGVIQRGAASLAIRTTDGPRPTKCGKGPGTEEEEEDVGRVVSSHCRSLSTDKNRENWEYGILFSGKSRVRLPAGAIRDLKFSILFWFSPVRGYGRGLLPPYR